MPRAEGAGPTELGSVTESLTIHASLAAVEQEPPGRPEPPSAQHLAGPRRHSRQTGISREGLHQAVLRVRTYLRARA
jgi:hypothetical protein